MFSQFNKRGQLGIRFSKDKQEKYIKELNTDYFKSYGAIMRGYILVPEDLWENTERITELLNESYDYVMSLESK
jgi:hypothetical protein